MDVHRRFYPSTYDAVKNELFKRLYDGLDILTDRHFVNFPVFVRYFEFSDKIRFQYLQNENSYPPNGANRKIATSNFKIKKNSKINSCSVSTLELTNISFRQNKVTLFDTKFIKIGCSLVREPHQHFD